MLKAVSAASFALLLACSTGTSQATTAHLEGVVQDPSGAVVQGAKVSVINTRTQARAETLVNAQGLFVFLSLQPGAYTLSVEAAGFRKAVVSGLELNVGATVSETIRLELGEVTESVTVAVNEVRVQTADAQIARAVTLREINVLPQLFRLPMALALFNPGMQIDPADWSASRVNGTRQGSNNVRLDGIDVSDTGTPRLPLISASTNTDSVEEFRIITHGGKAECGRSAGAQVAIITRSGSNAWHGNAFEYLRNTALNANGFFGNFSGLSRPAFRQNQLGGSLAGPILRNRTFIFANYQGKRTTRELVVNRLVLTPEAKAGLFRWRPPGGAAVQSFDIVQNDPRGRGIDPAVAANLALLPDPNNYDIGDGLNTAGFRFNTPGWGGSGDDYDNQYTLKADHNLSVTHRLFLRWNWGRSRYVDSVTGNEARYPGQPAGGVGNLRRNWSIGSDWTITARLANELRVGARSYASDFRRPARLAGPMLLANSWTDPLNPAFGSRRNLPMSQITDNLTLVHGGHTFKAGVDWRFTGQWNHNDAGIWPNVTFAGTDGNAPPGDIGPYGAEVISAADRQRFENLYNDLLGRMNRVTRTFYSDLKEFQQAGTPRLRDRRFHEYAYFFQDDWKLHPRLVLNLGLRYEFFGVPFETSGLEGTLDKDALINSAGRIADFTVQRASHLYGNDYNNLAPRVGFAWDMTGDGRTALRGNWGVFYDRLIGATATSVDGNTPGFALPMNAYPNRQPGSDVRVSDGIPPLEPPAAPSLRLTASRSTDAFLFAPGLRTGYVPHFSLTLQREIFRNTVVEAGYVGTHGVKLFMDVDMNQPRVYEDFLSAFRQLQAFVQRGTPVPASNTLVRMFGSTAEAISRVGAGIITQGAVGSAADSLDRINYSRYPSAGLSDFYLRNFPQFNRVVVGTNDGRSYYDSFQLSLRRQAGALRFVVNYTFSKSMDNISVDGQGFTSPIDNFNIRLNRARGDYDIPHAFNSSLIYTLPIGKGRPFWGSPPRWVDFALGGWDVGLLTIWQSGRVLTYYSGRPTGPTTNFSYADYSGDRNIGHVMRNGDGIYWLTPQEVGRFSYPSAGEIGTGGRNAFRGPRFFNVDMSLVKKFQIGERRAVSFRAEAYNLFNNVNFDAPNANLATPASFGKIANAVGNARILQMALRCDF
ncbi:MAG: TonB-dependent receptor [Bryobacteraceae bacterium]